MKTSKILLLACLYFSCTVNMTTVNAAKHAPTKSADQVDDKTYADTPDSIDVSKDLTRLQIASSNLLPGTTNVDAGPLLEAAVQYAAGHNIAVVSLQQGDYYFSTIKNGAFLYLTAINNVSLHGNGANFIFNTRMGKGILINNCNNTGIENITVDYANDLPFTNAIVQRVDLGSKTIFFSNILGRPITELDNTGKSSVKIFFLRKTQAGVNSITARMNPVKGLLASNNSITLQENDIKNIARIQPGDIACISERSYAGNNAISFVSYPPNISTGNYAKNVTIYSSPAIGLAALWQKNITFTQVHVEPKPGRDQYIGSNADGINITNGGQGVQVKDSYVAFSGDDGISFSTGTLGKTLSADQGSIVAELRYNLAKGQEITFLDPEDLHEIGSATITDLNQLNNVVPGKLKQYSIQLDKMPDGLQSGANIFLGENDRANGMLIEKNTVDHSFSRGIFFAGIANTRILSNTIRQSASCGIFGQTANERPDGFKSPENSNATIENNTIENAFAQGFTGQPGAIEMSIENGGHPASASVNRGLILRNNRVSFSIENGNHTAIRIANTTGYQLQSNTLQGVRNNGRLVELNNEQKIKTDQ